MELETDDRPQQTFDFMQSRSQGFIILLITVGTLLAGGGCVAFMAITRGTDRESAGFLGSLMWLFAVLGGVLVLARVSRRPMRIEIDDEGFTVVQRQDLKKHRYRWDQVVRYRQDTLVTEYATRDRLWLWPSDGGPRVEIETPQDHSARHREFLQLRSRVCRRLVARGVERDHGPRWSSTRS